MKHHRFTLMFAASAITVASATAQTPTQFQWLNGTSGFISNTELPTFGASDFVATADMDGDNDIDVVSGLTYIENEMVLGSTPSYGAFTANSACAIDPFLSGILDGQLADLDNDGFPELVAVTGTLTGGGGSVGVWRNAPQVPSGCSTRRLVDARSGAGGSWTYSLPTAGDGVVVVADFDGDGDQDIVTGGPSGVTLMRNNPGAAPGSRSFLALTQSLAGFSVSALAAADLDGDGDIDLGVGGGTLIAGFQTIALNNGTGTFAAAAAGTLPAPGLVGFPLCVTAADVDGDTDADLVFGYQATTNAPAVWINGGFRVYNNLGAGAFALGQVSLTTVSIADVAVGDVDEDGLTDLVASSVQEGATFPVGTFFSTTGTRMFSRPAAGAPFADVTLASATAPGRIGTDPLGPCFDPTNPIVDAIDPSTCLPNDGTGIALADIDLDLDLDIVVSYRQGQTLGMFTNLLWELETPRTVASVQISPGQWTWTIPYDHFCEFNVPNFGGLPSWAVVGVSLTPPTHLFPASGLGVLTSAPYVLGDVTFFTGGTGQFVMTLGPFTTAQRNAFIGTQLFATSAIGSLGRNVIRISDVVQTTLQ